LRENLAAWLHEVAQWDVLSSLTRGIFNAMPQLEEMFDLLHPLRRQDFSKGVWARVSLDVLLSRLTFMILHRNIREFDEQQNVCV
jgi:hypothetical protein